MSYGCPALVDGSPVGGGPGYLETFSERDTQGGAGEVVSTPAELKAVLPSASGKLIYVADGARLVLDESNPDVCQKLYYSGSAVNYIYGFTIPAGGILAAGRGRQGVAGGAIESRWQFQTINETPSVLLRAGEGARVSGLKLVGPQDASTPYRFWQGVRCVGHDVEIDNCEIHGTAYAGVGTYPGVLRAHVHHCNIHHCQRQGYGYPLLVHSSKLDQPSSMLAEGNYIDYFRHAIAATRGRSSYEFRYSRIGPHGIGSPIDCHGQNDGYLEKNSAGEYLQPAGEFIDVYNVTSEYNGDTGGRFVSIRGVPHTGGHVHVYDCWSHATSTSLKVTQLMDKLPEYNRRAYYSEASRYGNPPYERMEAWDCWFGTTAPPGSEPEKERMLVTVNVVRK